MSKLNAVDNWSPTDAALPTLLYTLADIFRRIPPPPQAFLWPDYFQAVVEAHDKATPIPEIPAHIYPKLRPAPPPILRKVVPLAGSTFSTPAAGPSTKQRSVKGEQGANVPPTERKQKRRFQDMEESSESDDDGSKGSVIVASDRFCKRPASGASDEDEVQLVQGSEDRGRRPGFRPGVPAKPTAKRGKSQSRNATPRAKKRTASMKSAQFVENSDEDIASSSEKSFPVSSHLFLTEAELQKSWLEQAGGFDMKGRVPRRSSNDCDKCIADGKVCWTISSMNACMYCRIQKKIACSNTIHPPKDLVKKETTRKNAKKDKAGKSGGAAKDAKGKETATSAPVDSAPTKSTTTNTKPPRAPSRLAASKNVVMADPEEVHLVEAATIPVPVADPLVCAPAAATELRCKYLFLRYMIVH